LGKVRLVNPDVKLNLVYFRAFFNVHFYFYGHIKGRIYGKGAPFKGAPFKGAPQTSGEAVAQTALPWI